MKPTDRVLPYRGTLTVSGTDIQALTLSVRCRVGSLYAAQSDSPNYNAKTGATAYFDLLTFSDVTKLLAVLAYDDARVILSVNGVSYEVTNIQDYEGFFKAPAVRCKVHGKEWQ